MAIDVREQCTDNEEIKKKKRKFDEYKGLHVCACASMIENHCHHEIKYGYRTQASYGRNVGRGVSL